MQITPPNECTSEHQYSDEQQRELAKWPALWPYIHSRKRINLSDGQPTHGTFDNKDTDAREVWIAGHHVTAVTTLWLKSDRLKELPKELQEAWGYYPPIPERKK